MAGTAVRIVRAWIAQGHAHIAVQVNEGGEAGVVEHTAAIALADFAQYDTPGQKKAALLAAAKAARDAQRDAQRDESTDIPGVSGSTTW